MSLGRGPGAVLHQPPVQLPGAEPRPPAATPPHPAAAHVPGLLLPALLQVHTQQSAQQKVGHLSVKIITDGRFGQQRSLKPPVSFDLIFADKRPNVHVYLLCFHANLVVSLNKFFVDVQVGVGGGPSRGLLRAL